MNVYQLSSSGKHLYHAIYSIFLLCLGVIHIVDWLARRLGHAQRLWRINNLRVYIGRYFKHHLFAIIDDCYRDYGNRATV